MKNIIAAAMFAFIAQPASATTFRLTLPQMDGITAGKYVAPAQVRLDIWNYWNNNKATWGRYKLDKANLDYLIQVEPNLNNGERVYRIKDVNGQFVRDLGNYFQRRNGKEWVHRAWKK